MLHVVGVNVSEDKSTVASPVSLLTTLIVTSDAGGAVRATSNVAFFPAPFSVTDRVVGSTNSPGTSSSVVVTSTLWDGRVSYGSSEEAAFTDTVTLLEMVPSTTESSTPVTLTVLAVFQFVDVNVSVVESTEASVSSVGATLNTTVPSGCDVKTTVKEPEVVPASSSVNGPPVTVNPGTSLSLIRTLLFWPGTASKASSEAAASILILIVSVYGGPSTHASSTAVTVSGFGTLQSVEVNVRELGLTVASAVSTLLIFNTTGLVGWDVRTTLNRYWPPPSVASRGLRSATTKPTGSLSVVVTSTVSLSPKKWPSEPAATDTATLLCRSGSCTRLSTPVTDTVCRVFQPLGANVSVAESTVAAVGSLATIVNNTGDAG